MSPQVEHISKTYKIRHIFAELKVDNIIVICETMPATSDITIYLHRYVGILRYFEWHF